MVKGKSVFHPKKVKTQGIQTLYLCHHMGILHVLSKVIFAHDPALPFSSLLFGSRQARGTNTHSVDPQRFWDTKAVTFKTILFAEAIWQFSEELLI